MGWEDGHHEMKRNELTAASARAQALVPYGSTRCLAQSASAPSVAQAPVEEPLYPVRQFAAALVLLAATQAAGPPLCRCVTAASWVGQGEAEEGRGCEGREGREQGGATLPLCHVNLPSPVASFPHSTAHTHTHTRHTALSWCYTQADYDADYANFVALTGTLDAPTRGLDSYEFWLRVPRDAGRPDGTPDGYES